MKTQWENFLQNLGQWEGSFTQVSATGDLLEETPTLLSLEGLDDDSRVRLTLRRFEPGSSPSTADPVHEMVREYESLGRDILFFETGAFSQGSIQRSPVSNFGAEFGFVSEGRRLRVVQLFDRDGELEKVTLIREKQAGSDAAEKPPLTVGQLLGTWQGEALTLYPDWRTPDTFPTTLHLQKTDSGVLEQKITFGKGTTMGTIASKAQIKGKVLQFNEGSQPVRVIMLPDGASISFPLTIKSGHSFFLEAGWLIESGLRQRLIRSYNAKGEWVSLTLVTQRKVTND